MGKWSIGSSGERKKSRADGISSRKGKHRMEQGRSAYREECCEGRGRGYQLMLVSAVRGYDSPDSSALSICNSGGQLESYKATCIMN